MYGGSFKKKEIDNYTNWMSLEPCIPPGVLCLPCMYQFESDLPQLKSLEDENLVHQD